MGCLFVRFSHRGVRSHEILILRAAWSMERPAADVDSPFQFVAEDGFMSAPLRNFVLAPVEVFGGIMQMNVLSESSTGSGGRPFSHRPRHFATLF